jgi:FkbM family methyltransferase
MVMSMPSTRRLTGLFSGVRDIRGGPAAGLKIIPLMGDREIALGTYEGPVQQALMRSVTPGAVVYDIGANIGFFTMLSARLAGPGGQVYAFEPVARNAAAIGRSARLNGFGTVTVFDCAVGAAGGMAELNTARHIGGAMLASVGAPPDRSGSVEVEVVVIDDLLRDGRLRPPTLVKIDVEGAELDVLRGMTATLSTHAPVLIVELDDATRTGLRVKSEALADLLHGLGYGLAPLAPSYPAAGWSVAHFLARPGAGA